MTITDDRTEYLRQWSKQRASDHQGAIVAAVLDATQATVPDIALISAAEEKVGLIIAGLIFRSLQATGAQP